MRILKFGGTSLDGQDRVQQAASIIRRASQGGPIVVVVSALATVTNTLTLATTRAVAGRSLNPLIDLLADRHHRAIPAGLGDLQQQSYADHVRSTMEQLRRLLDGVSLLGECPPSTRDQILATGERLSAPLVTAVLESRGLRATTIDGSRLIATGPPGRSAVEPIETCRRVGQVLGDCLPGEIPVVSGFIGSDSLGHTTTLGRGASDLSATLLAMALDADEVEIWTDVDGVLSAEPRWVPEATTLPHLTYSEATDLACFGARVLHPQTLRPLLTRGIPAIIRNSRQPKGPGTRIDAVQPEGSAVRAITAIPEVVRFLVQTPQSGPGHVTDLNAFGQLAEPPLLLSWENPGRTYSLVARSDQSEHIADIIERHSMQVLQREELALVAAIGGPEMNLPLLQALSQGGVVVKDLALSGSATRVKTLLIERSMLRSTVRLLHCVLIHDRLEFPPQASHVTDTDGESHDHRKSVDP